MSNLPVHRLPNAANLIGRLYTNNNAPDTVFAIKDNLAAGAAPIVANDSTQGYGIGSMWMDLTNEVAHMCFSAAVGAAIWIQMTLDASATGVPVGTILAYTAATSPTGFILATGVDQNRVALANLHALYQADGYIYGIGDGATTFGIPDMRGRVAVGKDDMGGIDASRMTAGVDRPDGDILGAAGGLETNTLLITNMPSHTHTGSTSTDGAHTHNVQGDVAGGGSVEFIRATSGGAAGPFATSSAGSHSHTLSLSSTGGSNPHDNVQPSLILNMILKT